MFNWKDRKYINPRKRVFKNTDTNEILHLELQDDPNNIEEESETPLTAHCLNQAQQELIDDMSKTYTGTNITANTIAGYGRINKLYGKTTEEGTGDKSPTNPYTLKSVGDITLSSTDLENGSSNGGNGVNVGGTTRVRTKELISLPIGTYKLIYQGASKAIVQQYDKSSNFITELVSWTTGNVTFTLTQNSKIKLLFAKNDNSNISPSDVKNIQIIGKSKIEIISKNGSNTSSNIVYLDKPLCSIGDVRDELDYVNKKVIRRCGYIDSYNGESISTDYISSTGNLSTGATVVYALATPIEEDIDCSNKIVQYTDSTNIYNTDGAEIEVSLTNSKAISEINENIDEIEKEINEIYKIEEIPITSLMNGATVNDGWQNKLTRIGNLCHLELGFVPNTTNNIAIYQIPAQFVPKKSTIGLLTRNSLFGTAIVTTSSNGQIQIQVPSNANVTWTLNATWFI